MSDQPWFQINRDLLVYKVFYFFFLSGFGSIFPYLPVYFRQIGLPASQVGLLLGLRPIVQFASAPFWAIMADKYRKRKSVLVMSVLAWLIMTLCLAFVEPTNEICEIREGNDTHKHVVNYTRVRTGFFKRSLLWYEDKTKNRGGTLERSIGLKIAPSYLDHVERGILASRVNSSRTPRLTITSRLTKITQRKSGMKIHRNRILNATVASKTDSKRRIDRIYEDSSITRENSREDVLGSNSIFNDWKQKGTPNNKATFSKTRQNNRVKSIPSRLITSPPGQNINMKHFSRFHEYRSSTNESKRRMSFLRTNKLNYSQETRTEYTRQLNVFNQTNSQRSQDNAKNIGFPYSGGKIANYTSNSMPRGWSIGNKNSNTTNDKRRENKAALPVVIELSRIFIPQNNDGSIESSSEVGSGHFESLNADNQATFGSHETSFHSPQLPAKTTNENNNPVSIVTISSTSNTSKTEVKAISKNLLKLSGQLSRSKVFDPKGSHDNGYLEEVQVVSDNSVAKLNSFKYSSSPTKSLTSTPLDNKSYSKGKDNLHPGDLHQQEMKFVLHNNVKAKFDLPVVERTKARNGSAEKAVSGYRESKISPLNVADVESGSGIDPTESLLLTKLAPSSESDVETETKEGAEHKVNLTDSNWSLENGLTRNISVMKKNASSTYTMQVDTTQLGVNKDNSRLKVWMTNLLKTNAFELKRLFTILLVLVVVGEFLEAPSSTLADASLLEHLGEERRYYGKQRLWGSLGFGLSSFFVGILLERSRHTVCGDEYTDYMICFCVFAVLMLLTLFISTTFKFKYKETIVEHTSVLSALFNIHYGSCLVAACFMGIGHGMSHSFLNWFLEDLGATKTLMGVAVICRSTLDLLTFFLAGSLIKAVGQIKIMAFSLISYGIAFTLYSLLTNPWWVLPIEMLVGCTYAASWSACTSYMAGAASAESVTTIQGMYKCHQ